MKIVEKLVGVKNDKKAFREYRRREKALPKEYGVAFGEIEKYIWTFGGMDGSLDLLYDLMALFESAAADGKKVLDITGDDAAGFCDRLIEEWKSRTWHEEMRKKFNEKFHKKLEAFK